ncbi:hypothetical protein E1293_37175 [Actinomadura darangshiensis]|uniref:Uncharacterized protein n=1 Tax=Actinomadura darangshiensis TaxID=705336 RepID=A0A4R5AEF1_9ACTN|nr:hypothetical protein E1293_37175 [Actinomadura darangshiensis]
MTGISCRVLTDRLVGLGVITPDGAGRVLRKCARWAPDLDEEQELADLVAVFEEAGIAVRIPDKVDGLEDAYRSFLEEAAACSGGAVTIDGVELVDEVLHFRRDGRPHRWELEHLSYRYVDTLTLWENIGDLAPTGPTRERSSRSSGTKRRARSAGTSSSRPAGHGHCAGNSACLSTKKATKGLPNPAPRRNDDLLPSLREPSRRTPGTDRRTRRGRPGRDRHLVPQLGRGD